MALDTIRHDVVQTLAQTNELIREARSDWAKGGDADKVKAAGELDCLLRQKAMLQARLTEIDERLTDRRPLSWLRQEWFNFRLYLESWIAHG
jgi:hypothetical protein